MLRVITVAGATVAAGAALLAAVTPAQGTSSVGDVSITVTEIGDAQASPALDIEYAYGLDGTRATSATSEVYDAPLGGRVVLMSQLPFASSNCGARARVPNAAGDYVCRLSPTRSVTVRLLHPAAGEEIVPIFLRGSGSVSGPGVSCPGDSCALARRAGSAFVLRAAVHAPWVFARWSLRGRTHCVTATCSFTSTGAARLGVLAIFERPLSHSSASPPRSR